jgi:HEAT repeat protein
MLKDTDWRVRAAAAESLGILGVKETLPSLLEAFADNHAGVRSSVAAALMGFDSAAVADTLVKAAADSDESVRDAALESLGAGKDGRALNVLLGALRTDSSVAVRESAAFALGELGDARAITALRTASKTDEDARVRQAARNAIEEIQSGGE